jgi:cytochrome d ubiquinol oxidase subunit I
VPETLFGHLNSDGTVTGGIKIPGFASILSDPATGTATEIQGLDSFPQGSRPTTSEVNTVHLAWDVMVGTATLLFLLALWYGAYWVFRRDVPKTKWFWRAAAVAGVASVLALEAGWVVTEVGRQPWIVFDYMKVEAAATGNEGVWLTFLVVAVIYAVVAVSLILILHLMARRFREQDDSGMGDDVPYGPREPLDRTPVGVS